MTAESPLHRTSHVAQRTRAVPSGGILPTGFSPGSFALLASVGRILLAGFCWLRRASVELAAYSSIDSGPSSSRGWSFSRSMVLTHELKRSAASWLPAGWSASAFWYHFIASWKHSYANEP